MCDEYQSLGFADMQAEGMDRGIDGLAWFGHEEMLGEAVEGRYMDWWGACPQAVCATRRRVLQQRYGTYIRIRTFYREEDMVALVPNLSYSGEEQDQEQAVPRRQPYHAPLSYLHTKKGLT